MSGNSACSGAYWKGRPDNGNVEEALLADWLEVSAHHGPCFGAQWLPPCPLRPGTAGVTGRLVTGARGRAVLGGLFP